MDGFNGMFRKLFENILLLVAIAKETIVAITPAELGGALQYLWTGLLGLGNWVGFAFSAAYFVGLDFGYGEILCEVAGYGFYLIDALNTLANWAGEPAAEGDAAAAEGDAAATEEAK